MIDFKASYGCTSITSNIVFNVARYFHIRSLMNCLWLPIRLDYIIILVYCQGVSRFGLLSPTPCLDSRCTFPFGLGSGLSYRIGHSLYRMFPEFRRFFDWNYFQKRPSLNSCKLLNLNDLIEPPIYILKASHLTARCH